MVPIVAVGTYSRMGSCNGSVVMQCEQRGVEKRTVMSTAGERT
jgi:hypothetical protein